jgi:AAA domain/CHC2 zinc finger
MVWDPMPYSGSRITADGGSGLKKQQIVRHFRGDFRTFYKKYIPSIKSGGEDEYMANCPLPEHVDANPSFTFNSKTGKFHCHGCGKGGDFLRFYGEMKGLSTKSDFPLILKSIADDFGIYGDNLQPKIVMEYNYLDEEGNQLFQVCRMEPKSFRQRHRNGDGGWKWGVKGVRRTLYRLPEIQRANEIIIVEGEKDSDNLAKLGFTATTCPMGAGKWREEYNEFLAGKDVVLIPDFDPRGREHMEKVGNALHGVANSVKWLDLPDLPAKGDVSDFIDVQGADAAERLAIMIEGAEPYEPNRVLTLANAIMDVTNFCSLRLPERSEYLHPWLKSGSMNLIAGGRNVGKTWFAISILDAVTKGGEFGPWKCKESVPCLLLDGEMPAQDIIERLNGLNLNINTSRQSPLYVYSDAYAYQCGLPKANLGSESWRNEIKHHLLYMGVKLWVIDNIASLTSGFDENVKTDWDPVNQWLLELRFTGISTILLHHTGKGGDQRGTSAREDNLDTSIMLKKPHNYTSDDGARFVAQFTKKRVRTKYSYLVADTEFKLTQDETGAYVWGHGDLRRSRRVEVLQKLNEGEKQNDIAAELGMSKGQVSKIKKKAIGEGILTRQNKLVQPELLQVTE